MALLISIFKTRLINNQFVCNNSSNGIDSRGNKNNNNSKGKRSRKKLTKIKSENLAESKKITRNNVSEIRPNFLIFITKKTFN